MVQTRGFLRHYWTLLKSTPGHVWRAADVIGRAIFLLALVLFAAFGFNGTIPLWFVSLTVLLFVLGSLAWTEYDRYTSDIGRRDLEILELKQRLSDEFQENLAEPFHQRLIKDLTKDFSYGYGELVRRLDNGEGTEAELAVQFENWDSNVARHVGLIDAAEVPRLREPMDSATLPDDWRQRLRAIVEVRWRRMEAIQARQKFFLDTKVSVRKKARNERGKARP